MRKFVVLALLFVDFNLFGKTTAPDQQANIRQQLVEELISEKLTLEDIEKKKRQLLSSLYELNMEMKKVNKEKAKLVDDMYVSENQINKITLIIESLENKIRSERDKLKVQLRALFQIVDQGALRLIFSNKTSHDLDRDLKFLKILMDQDYKSIKEYQRLISIHDHQKKSLKQSIVKLQEIKSRIKKKEQFILARQKEKKDIIGKIDTKRKQQISNIGSLREQTKNLIGKTGGIDEELSSLLQTSFFENRGSLAQPLQGPILRDFGLIKDEKFNVVMSSKGQFIKATTGKKVKSVYSGIVEFVGKIKSFGKTVILDHGDHYYSVYSHLDNIQVAPGDKVETLEAIASVGQGPFDLGSGLYFEIRHFSEPEDPNQWFKSINDGDMP